MTKLINNEIKTIPIKKKIRIILVQCFISKIKYNMSMKVEPCSLRNLNQETMQSNLHTTVFK